MAELSPEAVAVAHELAEFSAFVRDFDVAALTRTTTEYREASALADRKLAEAAAALNEADRRLLAVGEKEAATEGEAQRLAGRDNVLTEKIAEADRAREEFLALKATVAAEQEENAAAMAGERAALDDRIATVRAAQDLRQQDLDAREKAVAKSFEGARILKEKYEGLIAEIERLSGRAAEARSAGA